MGSAGVLRSVDAVTIKVPDLEAGLRFYRDVLGHRLLWRNDAIGQAGLALPDAETEIVLTTEHSSEPNWLVDAVDRAVETFRANGGAVLVDTTDIPVGHIAVVADPFGNTLVLIDLAKGRYVTDPEGTVTGVAVEIDDAGS
jgi:predicted enzyme related to lactoylglutathione lyase